MFELTVLLLALGVAGYVISLVILYLESESPVVSILNFACVAALVIGILIACNKVQEVECTKCERTKVELVHVKYCDVCGSELIPVNKK